MKFTATLEFLGVKNFTGKKDTTKTYHQATFLDGNDVLNVFIDDNIANKCNAKNFKRMQQVECDFEVTVGNYTNLKLSDINSIK